MPTEKQLANLKPIKDGDRARQLQEKSRVTYRKNAPKRKAIEQIKNEIIEKSFSKVYDLLDKEEITPQELISIFKSAIDMSGFKTSKQEIDGLLNTNIQKVYVTKEDKAKALKHIEEFIGG